MRRFVLLAAALFSFVFVFSACAGGSRASSAHSSSLITGSYDQVHIPYYSEYEPIGVVFATTEEYENIDSPFLTYLALMKKASDLGGHAIVNVAIEESRNCQKLSRDVPPYRKDEVACRVKRYGTALAIKYTKNIVAGPLAERTPANGDSAAGDSSAAAKSASVLPF